MAWGRHHNVLGWYARPLLLLPLAYLSYKRGLLGIALTFVALATGIFWFLAPGQVDPGAEELLAFEKEWLTGEWTLAKVLMTAIVPLTLGALYLAFWRRWCGAWSSSTPRPLGR